MHMNFVADPFCNCCSPQMHILRDGVCKFEVPKIQFSTLQLKLFNIELKLANKDAKHKKLLNILCIVYVLARSEPNYYNTSVFPLPLKTQSPFFLLSLFYITKQISSAHLGVWLTPVLSRKRLFESRCEKTGLRSFRPGPIQTRLYSHKRCLEV